MEDFKELAVFMDIMCTKRHGKSWIVIKKLTIFTIATL